MNKETQRAPIHTARHGKIACSAARHGSIASRIRSRRKHGMGTPAKKKLNYRKQHALSIIMKDRNAMPTANVYYFFRYVGCTPCPTKGRYTPERCGAH